jgi:cytidylate kinase
VAARLGFTYIDSGAMYRAAALRALRSGVELSDHARLGEVAREARIELTERGRGPVLLDGEDVTVAIRSEEVSAAASVVSSISEVRAALVPQQRAIGARESCVMEGRDIGTVVFPDADLKVFLVATIEERARRRCLQSEESGSPEVFGETGTRPELDLRDVSEDDIARTAAAIAQRDRRDTMRSDSPLVKAGDAVEVDTTSMTIEEQVDRVIELAVERGARPPDEREVSTR